MARPQTRAERDAAHRGKNNSKKSNKKKPKNRVTYITQADGTSIPVVNYLDTIGWDRQDLREMLEIYSVFGSRGREMWEKSQQAITSSVEDLDEELSQDNIVSDAARRENVDSYKRAMSGFVDYAERQQIAQSNWMERERNSLRNYMLRMREAQRLLAERMQRNINLAAINGGPGAAGGRSSGGGGGWSSGSSSAVPSQPAEQPQDETPEKIGDFQILYPNLDSSMTRTAMGIPDSMIQRIDRDPNVKEFMSIVRGTAVNEGVQPEIAIAEIIAHYQNTPFIDREALAAAAQLVTADLKLAAGQINVNEIPEYIKTENALMAIGLDPQAEPSKFFENFEGFQDYEIGDPFEPTNQQQAVDDSGSIFGENGVDIIEGAQNVANAAGSGIAQLLNYQPPSGINIPEPSEAIVPITDAFGRYQNYIQTAYLNGTLSDDVLSLLSNFTNPSNLANVIRGIMPDVSPSTLKEIGDFVSSIDPTMRAIRGAAGFIPFLQGGDDEQAIQDYINRKYGNREYGSGPDDIMPFEEWQAGQNQLRFPNAAIRIAENAIEETKNRTEQNERQANEARQRLEEWKEKLAESGVGNMQTPVPLPQFGVQWGESSMTESPNAAIRMVENTIEEAKKRNEENRKQAEEARKRLEEWRKKLAESRAESTNARSSTSTQIPAPSNLFAIPGAPQPTTSTFIQNPDGTMSNPNFELAPLGSSGTTDREIQNLIDRYAR